jgi:Zn-dependent M28 family amino/carboxypeptidase
MPSTLRPRHAAALAATLLLALAGLAAGTAQADPPPGVPPAVAAAAEAAITEATLEAPIRFLADDLLEGRGPATRGDRLTQLYLASTMGLLGLEPAGPDGSWLQPFDVVGITSTVPRTWTFERGGDSVTLDFWDEFIAGSGVQRERSTIDGAELVFVGYGIEAPEHRWDDFKGADLAGRVLVMLNNDPDWDPELFEGETRLYYGRWTYKYESAAAQGAVGAIVIHTTPSAGYPFQVVQTSWTGEQFELPAGDEPRLEVAAWTTEEAMKRLFALAGEDYGAALEAARSRDFRPIPLGVTTSLALSNAISRVQTANVAGLLPGGDPELADEVVVYTAHHDHLGIAPADENESSEEGDRIYNGALDNASGVAQVLAIARAMSESPERPRRSQLFLFVGAEEQGLLGSKYYAAHPTVEPGRIAANLNFDGANIWGETRDLTVVGKGKSDLDAVAEKVAAAQGRKVLPDQFPDRGYYYRSDQFSFAKIGVPALYFDTGTDFVDRPEGWGKERVDEWTGEHYHQPSDELIDDWEFAGMVEDCRLGFYAGWLVSQADAMPAWTPGDEFEAAREEAIEALAKKDWNEFLLSDTPL